MFDLRALPRVHIIEDMRVLCRPSILSGTRRDANAMELRNSPGLRLKTFRYGSMPLHLLALDCDLILEQKDDHALCMRIQSPTNRRDLYAIVILLGKNFSDGRILEIPQSKHGCPSIRYRSKIKSRPEVRKVPDLTQQGLA